jgi:hypothetical protein
MSETMKVEDDGHHVVDRLPLQEWVRLESDEVGEYVHLVHDAENRTLRCYFSVEPENPEEHYNARIKTTIYGVDMKQYTADRRSVDIENFFLSWTEAMNFMAFAELFSMTNNGDGMSITWGEADGGPMMDDEETSMEALNFIFTNERGNERHVQIRSEWQAPSHRMANIDGEGY